MRAKINSHWIPQMHSDLTDSASRSRGEALEGDLGEDKGLKWSSHPALPWTDKTNDDPARRITDMGLSLIHI